MSWDHKKTLEVCAALDLELRRSAAALIEAGAPNEFAVKALEMTRITDTLTERTMADLLMNGDNNA